MTRPPARLRRRLGLLASACVTVAGCTTVTATPETSPSTTAPGRTQSSRSSAATVAPNCSDGPPCYAEPSGTGSIPKEAPEASGLAASSTDPSLYFTVDDATGTSEIIAVKRDGTVVGVITIAGMSARNAEALVNGVCSRGSTRQCLYVGDIGGNDGRAMVSVYRVAQPDAAKLPTSLTSVKWDFSYPDGSHNAEAMLVSDDGSIVVITKPDRGATPHRVYRGAAGGGKLTLVDTFTPPPSENRSLAALVSGNVVTDASRLADRVLLITYDQALEYRAPTAGADPATFADWQVRQLRIPGQDQSEGVTYAGAAGLKACGFLVVSEKGLGSEAKIGAVDCR